MAKVDIYTKKTCPYCIKAKALLDRLNVDYNEIPVDFDPEMRAHMEALTNGYTVPQIIIDGRVIGGCDNLHALHARNELEPLLV